MVGINYAVNAEFRQSFAIGRAQAMPIIEQLRLGQDVDALGINGEAFSDGADFHGIWVYSVQSGSPADQAGVQGGDFILTLENIGMAGDGTMKAYCEVVRSHGAADTLNFELFRPATSELCTGQLNGRALACQPVELLAAPEAGETLAAEDDQTAGAATAQSIQWQTVTHESGQFSLSIPAAWTQQESTTIDDRQQLVVKSESDSSAAVFSLYLSQGPVQDADNALAEMRQGLETGSTDLLAACTYAERKPFTSTKFQGALEHWSNCGPERNSLFTVAMWPIDQQAYHLYAIILWHPAWDTAAIGEMLDSLTVSDQVTVVVRSKILNVRSGPGTNYGAVGQLQGGTRLPVIAQAYTCTWLQVQLPDGKQGWIAGQAPYATVEGNCAELPQGKIPPAPVASGGGGGNGCILFQNSFNDEATVTLTSKDGQWNKTFKIGRKANYRECLPPGSYTYTIDVPPPWGSINGKLDIQRGRTITFPIYGN